VLRRRTIEAVISFVLVLGCSWAANAGVFCVCKHHVLACQRNSGECAAVCGSEFGAVLATGSSCSPVGYRAHWRDEVVRSTPYWTLPNAQQPATQDNPPCGLGAGWGQCSTFCAVRPRDRWYVGVSSRWAYAIQGNQCAQDNGYDYFTHLGTGKTLPYSSVERDYATKDGRHCAVVKNWSNTYQACYSTSLYFVRAYR
jgi:hypothetical protein